MEVKRMASNKTNRTEVPEAKAALDRFKTEVASELDGGFTIVLKEDTDVYMHTAPVPFGRKPMKWFVE